MIDKAVKTVLPGLKNPLHIGKRQSQSQSALKRELIKGELKTMKSMKSNLKDVGKEAGNTAASNNRNVQ